jgi:hypothetical protein
MDQERDTAYQEWDGNTGTSDGGVGVIGVMDRPDLPGGAATQASAGAAGRVINAEIDLREP